MFRLTGIEDGLLRFQLTAQAAGEYLRALEARKLEAASRGQIDNSRLQAGSPMYFYCKVCGLQADVKPENYTTTPKQHCEACQEMINRGYSPTLEKFPGIDL